MKFPREISSSESVWLLGLSFTLRKAGIEIGATSIPGDDFLFLVSTKERSNQLIVTRKELRETNGIGLLSRLSEAVGVKGKWITAEG